MKLSVYKFKNYNNKEFIYCSDLNTLFEYTELIEKVLINADELSDEEIIISLGKKYRTEYVRKQVSIIRQWAEKNAVARELSSKNNTSDKWDSLWLNISHDCNLRCIYCYGNGGDYSKKRELMDITRAKEIIDYWNDRRNKNVKEISVVFFGGEPLMNRKVMLFAVQYINSLVDDGIKIKYALTTNGTIMDQELVKFFKDNRFTVTISIDGGKQIQDRNRPYSFGQGSFDNVKENIALLSKNSLSINGRMTLTKENGGMLVSAVKELWELGINSVACEMVASEEANLRLSEEDINNLSSAVEELGRMTYDNIINKRNLLVGNIMKYAKIMHNHMKNRCLYYSGRVFMVDPNGDVVRCHRMAGDSNFITGNVIMGTGSDSRGEEDFHMVGCEDCWARNICVPCPQVNYLYNNQVDIPHKNSCLYMKMVIEESLRLYATLYERAPRMLKAIFR